MNQADRKEFELIHNKIDPIKADIVKLKQVMDQAHIKSYQDIKFIKENLFDPHKGLWAETKENSQFRISTKKWRTTISAAFMGLFGKMFYDMFS